MAKRAFVISMDLIMAIGLVLLMLVMLTSFTPYEWGRYNYVSDAVAVMQYQGISNNQAAVESTLLNILPYESYTFKLLDFGSMSPYTLCSDDSDCPPMYPSCIFYICGDYALNLETGIYKEYSDNPTRYCSQKMLDEGSCEPEGDISQRMYVETGDDDRIDNFYIVRLEVAK